MAQARNNHRITTMTRFNLNLIKTNPEQDSCRIKGWKRPESDGTTTLSGINGKYIDKTLTKEQLRALSFGTAEQVGFETGGYASSSIQRLMDGVWVSFDDTGKAYSPLERNQSGAVDKYLDTLKVEKGPKEELVKAVKEWNRFSRNLVVQSEIIANDGGSLQRRMFDDHSEFNVIAADDQEQDIELDELIHSENSNECSEINYHIDRLAHWTGEDGFNPEKYRKHARLSKIHARYAHMRAILSESQYAQLIKNKNRTEKRAELKALELAEKGIVKPIKSRKGEFTSSKLGAVKVQHSAPINQMKMAHFLLDSNIT